MKHDLWNFIYSHLLLLSLPFQLLVIEPPRTKPGPEGEEAQETCRGQHPHPLRLRPFPFSLLSRDKEGKSAIFEGIATQNSPISYLLPFPVLCIPGRLDKGKARGGS